MSERCTIPHRMSVKLACQVKEEHSKRMHATRIGDGGRITFGTCLQGSHAAEEPVRYTLSSMKRLHSLDRIGDFVAVADRPNP